MSETATGWLKPSLAAISMKCLDKQNFSHVDTFVFDGVGQNRALLELSRVYNIELVERKSHCRGATSIFQKWGRMGKYPQKLCCFMCREVLVLSNEVVSISDNESHYPVVNVQLLHVLLRLSTTQ